MPQEQSARTGTSADPSHAYQFEDMRLKPGDRLQVQLPATVAEERQIVRLIGYLDKQCVLTTAPGRLERHKPLVEGDQIEARVFLGQGAYGFVSFVDKIIRLPFEYLHLTFPKTVQGLLIRNAPRVKTEMPVSVTLASGSVDAVAANLSATGMMLQSRAPLGKEGDELSITLPLELYQVKSELQLRGKVKTHRIQPRDGGEEEHRTGVEFLALEPNATLILQGVVHHELSRNPYSVV